jgi:Tfp pilus assembly protein FimT
MIYFTRSTLSVLAALLFFAISSAIAQTCPSTSSAAPDAPFWMQNIGHRGVMPYNGDAGYKVFRNVKDFGARGDGETDDTEAIKLVLFSTICNTTSVLTMNHL